MLWFGFGGAGAAPDAEITFMDTDNSGSNASSYTFSTISIGAAAADRFILVGASSTDTDTSAQITGCTINGNAATLLARATDTAGSGCKASAAIFGLLVNSNTTATIVITLDGTTGGMAVAVWKANKLSSTTPNDTLTVTDADPLTGTLDVQAGGVAVGMVAWINNGGSLQTTTWTGLTEDVDDNIGSESGKCFSGAHLASSAGSAGMTVAANASGTPSDGGRAMAAVALR